MNNRSICYLKQNGKKFTGSFDKPNQYWEGLIANHFFKVIVFFNYYYSFIHLLIQLMQQFKSVHYFGGLVYYDSSLFLINHNIPIVESIFFIFICRLFSLLTLFFVAIEELNLILIIVISFVGGLSTIGIAILCFLQKRFARGYVSIN